VPGTLDLLIPKTVSFGPRHGWATAKRIQQVPHEVLIQLGSLCAAPHGLEQPVLIKAKWAETETSRQTKFSSLTTARRARLENEET
jgi:PadR family transcriptional regulator PadR